MIGSSELTERPASDPPGRPPTPHAAAGSRWHPLLAIGATVVGWIVVSVGFGIGLPRAREDVAGMTLAVVPLVVGVALVAVASSLLFRVTHGWGRAILMPWTLGVLVGVYSLSIALAAVYPPHPISSSALPAGAIRIDMTAADGVHLAGWYLPSRNGAAVVLRHGAGSTSADMVHHARVLNAAGYGVLATDARGHGESGGWGMDLGWYGDLDIRAAVDVLAHRADVDTRRIGIVGLSMGGEEAIGAAGVDGRIRAVVAEGATGRTAADKTWLAEQYGVLGVVQTELDTVTYGLVDMLTPADPPATLEQSVRDSTPTRLLLLASGERPDEKSVAGRLAAVDPGRVQVWIVPGAGHAQGLARASADWREHVIGFLDTALAVESKR